MIKYTKNLKQLNILQNSEKQHKKILPRTYSLIFMLIGQIYIAVAVRKNEKF